MKKKDLMTDKIRIQNKIGVKKKGKRQ